MSISGSQLAELALACDWAIKDQSNIAMYNDGDVEISINQRGKVEVHLSGSARTQELLGEWMRACAKRSTPHSVACAMPDSGPYVIRFTPKPS